MTHALGSVESLTASEQASLADAVTKLEAFMLGEVATAIARRLLFWRSLVSSAAQYGVDPSQIVGAALVTANALADRNAQSYADMLAGLRSGTLKLAVWTPTGETAQPMQLGVVRADVNPSALGQWQALPIVVRVVGQVAVAAGAWILANAWTTSRELEAQADKTRADTTAQITKTVGAIAKQDPAQATALANALAAAMKAGGQATPGVLDQLASAVQDVTGTAREIGKGVADSSGALLLLGFLYVLSQRRKNPRARAAAHVPALPAPRRRRRAQRHPFARSYVP